MAVTGPMFPMTACETLTMVIVRQLLFGLSVGPPVVGAIVIGMREALSTGLPDNMATSAVVCSFYTTMYAFGYDSLKTTPICVSYKCKPSASIGLGPPIGALLVDKLGYREAGSVMFLVQVLAVSTCCLILSVLLISHSSAVIQSPMPACTAGPLPCLRRLEQKEHERKERRGG